MTTTERTQKQRHLKITTPLGEDKLLLVSMFGSEALGRLFEFELDLAAESEPIKPADILGKSVTIALKHIDDEADPRYFNGIINRISLTGVDQTKESRAIFTYRATLVPKLWLLTRCADCRIFQNKKVPDIVQQIFRDHGYTDIDSQLTRTYREFEYCVQYRETDFNFVSRLMENEGIYYFFKHANGKHTIVLCDAPSCHSPAPNYDKLEFDEFDPQSGTDDYIWDWAERMEITPTKYVITDYNFTTPSTKLEQLTSISHSHDPGPYEIFDYPGVYTKGAEGKEYVAARMQELQAQYIIATAHTSARGLQAGVTFKMEGHPITPNSESYLVTSANYQFHNDDMGLGLSGGGEVFACQITAIPNKHDFRTQRTTPKPVVQGPQTAKVVGPSGEEIYTDKYGRIKVHFYWDRANPENETASCWMRVSQPWAGKNYGGVAVPRIGQEVVVSFLEGDPDQPLVTGRVYNNEQMPPFTLPGSKMVMGMKSNSTPGGGGYNEISMDDTKGTEKVTIHAQYDMNTTVEHDQTDVVHNNRTATVDVDDKETVTGTQTIDVTGDQTITLKANQKQTITGNQDESITGNQTLKVTGNKSATVTGNRSATVTGNDSHTVTGTEGITSTGAMNLTCSAAITITAATTITLVAGGSSITLGAAGITITAPAGVTIVGAIIKNNA